MKKLFLLLFALPLFFSCLGEEAVSPDGEEGVSESGVSSEASSSESAGGEEVPLVGWWHTSDSFVDPASLVESEISIDLHLEENLNFGAYTYVDGMEVVVYEGTWNADGQTIFYHSSHCEEASVVGGSLEEMDCDYMGVAEMSETYELNGDEMITTDGNGLQTYWAR
jgi:hypothetical protein